jgi:peptide/nickel transport system permease protein
VVSFLGRRIVLAVLVLVAFSFVSFVLFSRLQPPPRPEVLAQYWTWLKGVFQGKSLSSISGGFAPVDVALWHTTVLLAGAFVLVVVFSVGIAMVAALRRGSVVDGLLRGTSFIAWGVPAFLIALILEQLMSTYGSPRGLGPFPIAGWPGQCPVGIGVNHGTLTPCAGGGSGLAYVLHLLTHMFFPCIALALGFVGLHSRYLRTALLETLDAPFIVTARAKGLSESRVVFRHALRASLATFSSVLISDFGAVFGAAVGVDYVFELGGLGSYFIGSFHGETGSFDLYSVEALLLVTASLVLVASIVSEIVVVALDPRVRAEG